MTITPRQGLLAALLALAMRCALSAIPWLIASWLFDLIPGLTRECV